MQWRRYFRNSLCYLRPNAQRSSPNGLVLDISDHLERPVKISFISINIRTPARADLGISTLRFASVPKKVLYGLMWGCVLGGSL
jgi:hypothetical protein